MKRKILSIFMILIELFMINSCVFATTIEFDYNRAIEIAGVSETIGMINGDDGDADDAKRYSNKIIGIALGIVKLSAIGIAIIMLTFLSIKYMSAAPSEKADIKNQLVMFAVGASIVFGAAEILDKIMTFSQENIKL